MRTSLSREDFNKKVYTYHLMAKCIGWPILDKVLQRDFKLKGNKRQRKKLMKKIRIKVILDDLGLYEPKDKE